MCIPLCFAQCTMGLNARQTNRLALSTQYACESVCALARWQHQNQNDTPTSFELCAFARRNAFTIHNAFISHEHFNYIDIDIHSDSDKRQPRQRQRHCTRRILQMATWYDTHIFHDSSQEIEKMSSIFACIGRQC